MIGTLHSYMGICQVNSFSAFWGRLAGAQPINALIDALIEAFCGVAGGRCMLPGMKIPVLIGFAAVLLGAAAFLAQAQAPAASSQPKEAAQYMKSWLIRIIPPRPHFDQDASPAEQALMEQHLAYWKDRNEKGVCLFGGPVFDPRGVYGILVVRAASEDEARALGEGDPSVKGGLIKIEVAEMRVVFVPVHQP
jgi:uncharacterized protein YciI